MRPWRRGQYGPPCLEAGEKDKCRRCGGVALSGEGPADTPAEGCGRDKEEAAEVPSPCDSGRRDAVVLPEAELAEIDSRVITPRNPWSLTPAIFGNYRYRKATFSPVWKQATSAICCYLGNYTAQWRGI